MLPMYPWSIIHGKSEDENVHNVIICAFNVMSGRIDRKCCAHAVYYYNNRWVACVAELCAVSRLIFNAFVARPTEIELCTFIWSYYQVVLALIWCARALWTGNARDCVVHAKPVAYITCRMGKSLTRNLNICHCPDVSCAFLEMRFYLPCNCIKPINGLRKNFQIERRMCFNCSTLVSGLLLHFGRRAFFLAFYLQATQFTFHITRNGKCDKKSCAFFRHVTRKRLSMVFLSKMWLARFGKDHLQQSHDFGTAWIPLNLRHSLEGLHNIPHNLHILLLIINKQNAD